MFRAKVNVPLLVLALIGILLYFGVNQWYLNNGEADVEDAGTQPKISRETAETAARVWYKTYSASNEEARVTRTILDSDRSLNAYIGKHKLDKNYKEAYSMKYPLSFWEVELQPEDDAGQKMFVRIGSENADVIGWDETNASGSLATVEKIETEETLRAQDEKALSAAGYDPSDFTYRMVETKNILGQVQGYESRFTSSNKRIGDAVLTLRVAVSEGKTAMLLPYFETPQSFKTWLNGQERSAAVMSLLSVLLTGILGLVALIYVIVKRKKAWFTRGIVFTIATLILSFISVYNSLPAQITGLSPEEKASSGNTILLITSLVIYALIAIALYFQAVSGDQLWREKGWYGWMRWRDEGFGRHIYNSMGRGYLLCLFVLGVQQVLFLLADVSFGSFAINDPSQALENMRWPLLLPLMAWMAGISEEITYRLFGIVLFKKIVKLRFLAVLLPSLIWAMGHTGYAIYPSYTRLLEVAVLGIIFGYAFLKYGLYTAIFAHITMDSILMGLSLMIQGNADYTLAGFLYIILPFLFAAATLFLHSKFSEPRPVVEG